MDAFLSKHKRRIAGTLSCVDCIVFKGCLPISWADAFESFPSHNQCLIKDFQPFVQKLSAQVKTAAPQAAEEAGRPYIYLNHQQRKKELVKQIAHRDDIHEGLVCVLAVTEACQSFRICMNGHEWLERQRITNGIGYTKDGNCFSAIDDFEKAQTLSGGNSRNSGIVHEKEPVERQSLPSVQKAAYARAHRKNPARAPMAYNP